MHTHILLPIHTKNNQKKKQRVEKRKGEIKWRSLIPSLPPMGRRIQMGLKYLAAHLEGLFKNAGFEVWVYILDKALIRCKTLSKVQNLH